MRIALALACLLAFAPVAHAQQAVPSGAPYQANASSPAVQAVAAESKRASEQIPIEALSDSEDAMRQDFPRRGSFWWLVGAIVVAGVILAVVL